MSPSFHSLASRAKAHHEALNAAYATYYSGGVSPSASTRPSFESQNTQRSSSSQTSTSGMSKAWQSVKKAAKEHHQSVNAAYGTYYSGGVIPGSAASTSSSQRSSMESASGGEQVEKLFVREKESTWAKVKKAAKEHHRSANAAYRTYYGAGVSTVNSS